MLILTHFLTYIMQTWVYKYSLFEYIVCDLQDMNMNLPSIFSSEAEHQGNMPKSAENVYLVIYRPTEAPHFRSKEKNAPNANSSTCLTLFESHRLSYRSNEEGDQTFPYWSLDNYFLIIFTNYYNSMLKIRIRIKPSYY